MRHPVPAGHDEADRKTVLRRQRLPVDGIDHQHVILRRIGDRKAPLVKLLDPTLHAAVQPGEHDFESALFQSGFLEHGRKPGSGPFRRAHRLSQPGLAEWSW